MRPSLLTATMALSLLASCNRNPASTPTAGEPGTPPAAHSDSPSGGTAERLEPPSDTLETGEPPSGDSARTQEAPSGGTARAPSLPKGPTVFRVRDSGIRCIAPPCESFVASRPDRPQEDALRVTDVDFSALNLSEADRERLTQATQTDQGVKLEATVEVVPNAGPGGAATVLRVTRLLEDT